MTVESIYAMPSVNHALHKKMLMTVAVLVVLWSIDFVQGFSTKEQFEAGLGDGFVNFELYTDLEFQQMKIKRARALRNRHNLKLFYNGILATIRRQENRNYKRQQLSKSKLAFKSFGRNPCMPIFRMMKGDRRSRMNRQPEVKRIQKKINESMILLEDLIWVKSSLNKTFTMATKSMLAKRSLRSKMASLRNKKVKFLSYVPFEEYLVKSGNDQKINKQMRYSVYIEYYIEYMYRELHYLEYFLALNMHMNQHKERAISSEYSHFKDGIHGFRNIVCMAYYYVDYVWKSPRVTKIPLWIRNTDANVVKEATYLVLYHANRTVELMSQDLRKILSEVPQTHRGDPLPSDEQWKILYTRSQVKRSSVTAPPKRSVPSQRVDVESETPIKSDSYQAETSELVDGLGGDDDYPFPDSSLDINQLVENTLRGDKGGAAAAATSVTTSNSAPDNLNKDERATVNQLSEDGFDEDEEEEEEEEEDNLAYNLDQYRGLITNDESAKNSLKNKQAEERKRGLYSEEYADDDAKLDYDANMNKKLFNRHKNFKPNVQLVV